jgi:hypothetical protein
MMSGPGIATIKTKPMGVPSQYAHMSGCHSPAGSGASASSDTRFVIGERCRQIVTIVSTTFRRR